MKTNNSVDFLRDMMICAISVEQSQSERIVELEETNTILRVSNAVLSNTVGQMRREINDLRCQLSSKDTAAIPGAPSTSIDSAAKSLSACGAKDSLHDQTEAISEGNTQHKQVMTLEETIRVSDTQLLAKVNKLEATNIELTHRVTDMEMSLCDLKQVVADCNKSCTDQSDLLNAPSTASSATASTSSAETTTVVTDTPLTDLAASSTDPDETTAPSPSNMPASSAATTRVPSSLPTSPAISAERRKSMSEDLYKAALDGNAQRIHQLAAEGASTEYKGFGDSTALHQAASYGDLEVVRGLLELGARLEARSEDGQTPLMYAIWYKREECVELLLSAGASVNVRDKGGWTPLHHAAEDGTPSIVQMIIDAGADRGAKTNMEEIPKEWANDAAIRALL